MAGRAGRAQQPGEDILQTVNPEAEAAELLKKDPEMEKIIQERDAARMDTPEVDPVADPAGVEEHSPGACPWVWDRIIKFYVRERH